jgi:DNA/RNA endonuclease G (NUC1)
MPNVEDKRLETGDWRSYLTTAAKIEDATQFKFFSNLPAAVQKSLKAKTDSGR